MSTSYQLTKNVYHEICWQRHKIHKSHILTILKSSLEYWSNVVKISRTNRNNSFWTYAKFMNIVFYIPQIKWSKEVISRKRWVGFYSFFLWNILALVNYVLVHHLVDCSKFLTKVTFLELAPNHCSHKSLYLSPSQEWWYIKRLITRKQKHKNY